MKLVLATRNAHKVEELRAILTDVGLRAELVGLDAFPEVADVVEDGLTFEANALKKAREVADATGLPSLADDSGLAVDALNGMPGVFSARWAGRHGDDKANLDLLLAQIADVPDAARGAHFVCVAAIALPAGESRAVEGRIDGSLTQAPRGSGGFGYDPVFVPNGETRTTAEMSAADKHAISHRGRAFRAMAPVVAELLSPER